MSESAKSSTSELAIGCHIGPYRIVRQLGTGGMGTVYEALHETIERRVAVKVLLAKYASDATSVSRLMNEARAVNRVGHPGLVQVYDANQLPDGTVYLLMELLSGETLSERARRRRFSILESVRFGRQIAGALAAAHSKGIIHRDLKPDNVMIVSDPDTVSGERSKILDFGIAKLIATEGGIAFATSPDVVLGTPLYMSPEQCRGAAGVDERTDVYSLGMMLFWMLAGRPPFVGSIGDVIAKHMFAELPSLAELCPEAPGGLADLIPVLVAKLPQQRPSMSEVAAMLSAIESQVSASETEGLDSQPVSAMTNPALGSRSPGRSTSSSQPLLSAAALPMATPQAFALGGRPPSSRSTWRTALMTAPVGLLVAALGLGAPFLPHAAQMAAVSPGKESAAAFTTPAPPPAAAPAQVPQRTYPRVVIHSTPSGAQVLRAVDRKPLGSTPWQPLEQLKPGDGELLIASPGYAEQPVRLPLDADFKADVVLVPAPPAAVETPPAKVRAAGRPSSPPKKKVVNEDGKKTVIELEE